MIIVTGGAGFIGSALIWGLNEKCGKEDILIVDRVENQDKWKNLVKRQFKAIIDIDLLPAWLEKSKNLKTVDCIFHIGACSSTTEKDMDYLLRNNTDYTVDLFKICQKHKIPFIYASSAATYGDGSQGFSDEHQHINSFRPINPYGYSKHLADKWILNLAKKSSSFWCGLKYFNVYGPGEYHKNEMRSLVAKAFPQVKETTTMRLFKSYKKEYKDGDQQRDFIYIKDVVNIMIHIYENHKDISNGIYNVGTGKARSFLNLGQALFKALNIPERFEFIPMPENIRDQYQYFTQADTGKLIRDIKYTENMTSLEDGIRDYVQNYLNTQDPYL